MKHKNKKHRIRNLLLVLVIIAAVFVCAFAAYVNNYYHADEEAIECIENPQNGITVTEGAGKDLVFRPAEGTETGKGLVFYPGGKVEYTAYAPLMTKLAENGVECILVHVRYNLAIMDINAADDIDLSDYPEVTDWYIGGHSLGGVCAAMYLNSHDSDYEGLVLLGAYSSKNLSGTDLAVLSMYGENDGVMNREKYEENLVNLPDNFTVDIIAGGCHAGFGSYGTQKGDGTPSITVEEQQQDTADEISAWMNEQ